ncbi:hypothetical protein BDN72DRAFT_449983 [Pluteus cervinus]|uniref:Uncharacterized protein n=1 Tax=Pluteus cervinus TaxID=181527 RepID=A0ACD3BC66_9AGAR|nr:hypothetical protein BDN72DRAFT_449983 [Pluteus cervinus]
MEDNSPLFSPEILDLIVQALCEPSHPLQYGYGPQQLDTILQVCCCSRALYTFAVPRLYSSICLERRDQYTNLHQTLQNNPHLAAYTHSIFPKDIDDGLSEHWLGVLIEILKTCSPFLRRIVLDRPLRTMWPEDDIHGQRPLLRSALEKCQSLVEFSSIQCELFLKLQADIDSRITAVIWPQWTSLRRLCLRNPLLTTVYMQAIARLPLEEFTLHNPDVDYDETEILAPLLQRVNTSVRLTILVIVWPFQSWSTDWWCLASRELCGELRRPTNDVVVNVAISEIEDYVESWHEWLRGLLCSGSEWDPRGTEFSRFMDLHASSR